MLRGTRSIAHMKISKMHALLKNISSIIIEMTSVYRFIFYNIMIVVIFTAAAFYTRNRKLKQQDKKQQSFIEFMNNGRSLTLRSVFVGLVFGIIFGFIDNFGLWIGIDKLQRYMPGGVKMKAALGNTYSDAIGAILGTSISIMARDLATVDDSEDPLWVNPIGIIVGCLIGLLIGRVFLNRG